MTGTPNHFCRSNTYSTKSSFWVAWGIVGVPQKDRTYFQDGSSMMVFFPHHLQVKTCPCGQVHAWGGECREQLCSAIAGDLGDTMWGSPWTQTLQLCTLLKWFSKKLCFCRYVFVWVFVWFSSIFFLSFGWLFVACGESTCLKNQVEVNHNGGHLLVEAERTNGFIQRRLISSTVLRFFKI